MKLLVIIDDFYILGPVRAPAETDPELIIDSNAVLARLIAFERLQPIAGWRAQEFQRGRCIKLCQLAFCHHLNASEPSGPTQFEKSLRVAAAEIPNHGTRLQDLLFNVNR